MLKRKLNNTFKEVKETDDLVLNPSEFMEEQFLDEYFLLVRRVKGMGLTLNEFWDMDLFQFGRLLQNELKIIEAEEKEARKRELESKSNGRMTVPRVDNDPVVDDIYSVLESKGE